MEITEVAQEVFATERLKPTPVTRTRDLLPRVAQEVFATERLKLPLSLQWHFFVRRVGRASLGGSTRPAATSGEIAKPQPLVPTRQWSVRGWVPDARRSCGC